MSIINNESWLWDIPFGNPEAEDIGETLTEEQINEWEEEYGVRLPEILKKAYLQLNVGAVRGSKRGVFLVQLANIAEVDTDEVDMADVVEDDRFNTGKLFDIGGDDMGLTC